MPGFARGLRRRILTLSATRRFGERGGAFASTERIAMTSYVFTHATVLDGTEGMEPRFGRPAGGRSRRRASTL